MRNLAPYIFRKRFFIEGFYNVDINTDFIKKLLIDISNLVGMTLIIDPIIFTPSGKGKGRHHGIGGFAAWVESGISVYTWNDHKFFTIDIYTCKEIDVESVINFIKEKFGCKEFVYEEFKYE